MILHVKSQHDLVLTYRDHRLGDFVFAISKPELEEELGRKIAPGEQFSVIAHMEEQINEEQINETQTNQTEGNKCEAV